MIQYILDTAPGVAWYLSLFILIAVGAITILRWIFRSKSEQPGKEAGAKAFIDLAVLERMGRCILSVEREDGKTVVHFCEKQVSGPIDVDNIELSLTLEQHNGLIAHWSVMKNSVVHPETKELANDTPEA